MHFNLEVSNFSFLRNVFVFVYIKNYPYFQERVVILRGTVRRCIQITKKYYSIYLLVVMIGEALLAFSLT